MESKETSSEKYLSDTCVFESNAYESTLPSEDSNIQGVLRVVTGPVAEYGTKNRNGRVYSEKLWDSVLDNSYVKEQIKYNTLFGEANHPESRYEVDFGRVSHMIKKMWKVPASNQIFATIYILDTPLGKILDTLYKAGSIIGYSSRAGGTLTQRKDYIEVDEKTYNFITFDAVPFPSVASARPDEITEGVEQLKSLSEETHKELCKIINESSTISRSVIKDFIYSLKGYDVAPEKEILEGKNVAVGGADNMSEPCENKNTQESTTNEESKKVEETESKDDVKEKKVPEVEEQKADEKCKKESVEDESCKKDTEKKTVEAVEDESCKKSESKNNAEESTEKESTKEVDEKAGSKKKVVSADECDNKTVEENSSDKNMNAESVSIDKSTLSMLKENSLQIENLRVDNQTLKAVKESLERSNKGLSNSLNRALDKVANLSAENDYLKEEYCQKVQESVRESSAQSNNTIEGLKEEVQRLRNELADKDLELDNLSSVREAAKSLEYQNSFLKFNESNRENESTRLHESKMKVRELEEQVKEAYAEISDMVSEGNHKDSKIKFLEERVESLHKQNRRIEESVRKLNSLKEENSSLTENINTLRAKLEEMMSSKEKIEESAGRKMNSIKERYSEMQSEMNSLNEFLENEKEKSNRYKEDLISVISNGYGLTAESVKERLSNNFSKSDVYCVCEQMTENRKGSPVIVSESPFRKSVREENENSPYMPQKARDLFGTSRRGI